MRYAKQSLQWLATDGCRRKRTACSVGSTLALVSSWCRQSMSDKNLATGIAEDGVVASPEVLRRRPASDRFSSGSGGLLLANLSLASRPSFGCTRPLPCHQSLNNVGHITLTKLVSIRYAFCRPTCFKFPPTLRFRAAATMTSHTV